MYFENPTTSERIYNKWYYEQSFIVLKCMNLNIGGQPEINNQRYADDKVLIAETPMSDCKK